MWTRAAAAVVSCALLLAGACGRASTAGGPTRPAPARPPDATAAGAVDSLSGRDLTDRHVTEVAAILRGRVPGLQVIYKANGDISLRIRGGDVGLTGAGGGEEPLVVIDGMPVSEGQLTNALRALNPDDIARIEVLKDVSSTSVYGTRGAHGVVLITMKHQ
jgi:TonB-dependent starch-binding outer membrane protein SusC